MIGWGALLPQNEACREEHQTGQTQSRRETNCAHPFLLYPGQARHVLADREIAGEVPLMRLRKNQLSM